MKEPVDKCRFCYVHEGQWCCHDIEWHDEKWKERQEIAKVEALKKMDDVFWVFMKVLLGLVVLAAIIGIIIRL